MGFTDIEENDYQHDSLPPDLIKRLKKIKKTLGDADPAKTVEEFIDSFRRDENPEAEVCIWESIEADFHSRTAESSLDLKKKRGILVECIAESFKNSPPKLGVRSEE